MPFKASMTAVTDTQICSRDCPLCFCAKLKSGGGKISWAPGRFLKDEAICYPGVSEFVSLVVQFQ